MPSGSDALPWLGDYPYGTGQGLQGAHMIGTLLSRPIPSVGTQSGPDGAVSGSDFTATSGQFTLPNTGDTITITDTGATTPVTYQFTVTYVSGTELTLSGSWAGTGTSGLPWVLSGQGPSNAGLSYFATDGTDNPSGTLYHSTGTDWLPVAGASVALPPWFDYTPIVHVSSSGGGGDTDPTLSIQYAATMVQTTSGAQFPTGFPTNRGSAFVNIFAVFDTVGSVKVGGTSTGVLSLVFSDEPGTYAAASPTSNYVIGSGFLTQESTNSSLKVDLLSSGELFVANVPDLSPPPGGFQNLVRIANPYLTPATESWPFDWASGDTLYNGTGLFSMGVD